MLLLLLLLLTGRFVLGGIGAESNKTDGEVRKPKAKSTRKALGRLHLAKWEKNRRDKMQNADSVEGRV